MKLGKYIKFIIVVFVICISYFHTFSLCFYIFRKKDYNNHCFCYRVEKLHTNSQARAPVIQFEKTDAHVFLRVRVYISYKQVELVEHFARSYGQLASHCKRSLEMSVLLQTNRTLASVYAYIHIYTVRV